MNETEAMAFALTCKPGSEFDFLIFPTEEDARDGVSDLCLEEGDPEPVIVPLYPKDLSGVQEFWDRCREVDAANRLPGERDE